jgi:hypothetical protein
MNCRNVSATDFPNAEKEEFEPAHYPPLFRREVASGYLRLVHGLIYAPATLAKLASTEGGPPFHRAGLIPLYPRDQLDVWAAERLGPLVRSTSEGKSTR